VEKYDLKPMSLVSFPGKIPEKWAKLDSQKEMMKPEKAKEWAQEIALTITKKIVSELTHLNISKRQRKRKTIIIKLPTWLRA